MGFSDFYRLSADEIEWSNEFNLPQCYTLETIFNAGNLDNNPFLLYIFSFDLMDRLNKFLVIYDVDVGKVFSELSRVDFKRSKLRK